MSILKSNAITAVTNDTDVTITGAGTGGVAIGTHMKLAKGGDISSASPLVIDTDGTMFDVTGTTNFSVMTVEANRFFVLQFDGALTVTDGSSIVLPGNANVTTAAGDVWTCYATLANTVVVTSIETTAAPSSGFTLATEQASTSGTSVTFGSIPSGTKMIIIMLEGVSLSAGVDMDVTIGDGGGLETAAYSSMSRISTSSVISSTAEFIMDLNDAGIVLEGTMILTLKDSANFTWVETHMISGTGGNITRGSGVKSLSAELTQVSISGGTFDAGSINIMYQ